MACPMLEDAPHEQASRSRSRGVCGMTATGDLPWPLSVKLLPDAEEIEREKCTSFRLSSGENVKGSRICEAWFEFKGNRKCLQWQGPEGGPALLKQIANAYRIQLRDDGHPSGKLIFLADKTTTEVIDVDSPLVEGGEYNVFVEPEDATPFNIMPCFLQLCTTRLPRTNYLGE